MKRIGIVLGAIGLALGGCTDGYGYSGVGLGWGGGGFVDDGWGGGFGGGFAPGFGGGFGNGFIGGPYDYFGWNDGFFYPGAGVYVYDQFRRPFRWNGQQQRFWQGRRDFAQRSGRFGGRGLGPNWGGFDRFGGRGDGRFAGRGDGRGFNGDRRLDPRFYDYPGGRREFREDRREVRGNYRDFRGDLRQERREFRQDERADRRAFRSGDLTRQQFRAERRENFRDYRDGVRQERRELRRQNRRDIRD